MAYSTLTAVWVSLGLGIVTIRYLKEGVMSETAGALIGFILVGFGMIAVIAMGPSVASLSIAMIGSGIILAIALWARSKWLFMNDLAFFAACATTAGIASHFPATEAWIMKELAVRYLIGLIGFWALYFILVYPFVALGRWIRGSSKPNAAEATDGARKA
jgi:hypothetical protein